MSAILGTTSVEAKPNFAGGQLEGCTIEFRVLAQDWVYKQGAYIAVTGHFGVYSLSQRKDTLHVVLKVYLHDVEPIKMTFTPSPPAAAYFVSGNTTTKAAIVGAKQSDTPGAIFVILKPETFKVLADGLERDKVIIAFTQLLLPRPVPRHRAPDAALTCRTSLAAVTDL
jgi:hypothetical protein